MNDLNLTYLEQEADDFTLDHEARRKAALMGTPAERSRYVQEVLIATPELARSVKLADRLILRAGDSECPGGLCVHGDGGSGKSFVLDTLERRHPKKLSLSSVSQPFVRIKLSENPTPASIRDLLFDAIGFAGARTGNEKLVLQDLLTAFRELDVRMLAIDEAHHLGSVSVRRNKDRRAGQSGDFLKNLYDDTGVAFLFCGLHTIWDLLRTDTQFNSRWLGEVALPDYVEGPQWIALLRALDTALPMPEKSGLHTRLRATQLYQLSGGNLRKLKLFMAHVVRFAAEEGASRLEAMHFSTVFALECMTGTNPFIVNGKPA